MKSSSGRHRTGSVWLVFLALATAAVIFTGLLTGLSDAKAANKRELPIYCVEKQEKVASLTFDAAWGNEDTQTLIDIFDRYDIKVTFFVVGDWARKYPESVEALHNAGHEIMNHSDKHHHMPKLSREQIISDITACNDAIAEVTGETPLLFRPPYGDYDNKVISTLRDDLGMYTIQWDVDSLDWKDPPSSAIERRVCERVKPGSIVLFHNAAKNTPAALPGIIEKLQADGYKLIPASELICREDYTINHEGRQIPAAEPSAQ